MRRPPGRCCPGELAKTEAWYVLDAEPGAHIYAGLKPGVGPQQLLDGLAEKEQSPTVCTENFHAADR